MLLISMSMLVAVPVSVSMATLALADAKSIFHSNCDQECSKADTDTAEQKRI